MQAIMLYMTGGGVQVFSIGLVAVLALLAVASLVTVVQRVLVVRRQALAAMDRQESARA